jgi:hypothetical protein
VKRRLQYCLHENRFVEGDELRLVDNVRVFPKIEIDMKRLPTAERLAMFYLMVSYSGKIPERRPEGIYDGETLFNMNAFAKEYFILEKEEKVSKDDVIKLANKYFHKMEFHEDYILKKLLKVKAVHKIRYDKNRSIDKVRGNIGLKEKTLKIMKKTPDAFTPTETDSWRSHVPGTFPQVGPLGFGGVPSVPMTVFSAPSGFGGSAFGGSAVQRDPVPVVPKKKNKRVTISCKDHFQDDEEMERLSTGIADMVVDGDDEEDDEEEEDEDEDEEEEDEVEMPIKRSSKNDEIDMSQVRIPHKKKSKKIW